MKKAVLGFLSANYIAINSVSLIHTKCGFEDKPQGKEIHITLHLLL